MLILNLILKNSNRIIKLVVVFLLSFLQFYWSESKYSVTLSSACLECSFIEDLLLFTIITILLFSIVNLILKRLKFTLLQKNIIQIISLIVIWFWLNSQIFIERVVSWSTYTSIEILFHTLNDAILPIIFCSISFLFINYMIDKFRI